MIWERTNSSEMILEQAQKILSYINNLQTPKKYLNEIISFLCSTMFQHSLNITDYEMAYSSIVSNPSEERFYPYLVMPYSFSRYECLRIFVTNTCEKGELTKLNSLIDPTMIDNVHDYLINAAPHSDLHSSPNYFEILASLHIHRGSFQRGFELLLLFISHVCSCWSFLCIFSNDHRLQ